MGAGPKLLVTGFGAFPGAPENPTEALVRALADEAPHTLGAGAPKAVVLPTDYQRSWSILRRLYLRFEPDVVVHFGLNAGAKAIHIETLAWNRADPAKPDSAGYAPRSGVVRRSGRQTLASTFPADAILSALRKARIPAALCEDAGDYVCNATLYRSLHAAPPARRVGFVHVPGAEKMKLTQMLTAARIVLTSTLAT